MTTAATFLRLIMVALCVAFPACAAALPRDDAEAMRTLKTGDVYVSDQELGEVAPSVARRLQTKADQLRERGFDVKMAIVAPLGGEGVFGYAGRLRRRLGFEGTLLVTTLHGPVGASGDRKPDALRSAFTAANVNALGSATERLVTAADIAVPAPEHRSGWRGMVAFLALALLGGAGAVTWGLNREERRGRKIADQERGALVLGLDALNARLDALDAMHSPPRPDVAADLEEARHHHSAGRAAAQTAGAAFQAHEGFAALFSGLRAAARAAEALGTPFPLERPLEGLCGADPSHGPATDLATLEGGSARVPVCGVCGKAARQGQAPRRRMLPGVAGPIPFDEMQLSPAPHEEAPGPATDGATASRS